MVSENNLLKTLATLVAGFDDSSWEALASKGLLRRARKDIEKGIAIEVIEQTGDEVKLTVAQQQVVMTLSGPATASCNCPMTGVCQHILAACLFIQSLEFASESTSRTIDEASFKEELAQISLEDLRRWAGKDYKPGVGMFEKNSAPPVLKFSDTVVIQLMPSNLEVRFVPTAGLDGLILPRPQGKKAGVAALLRVRQHLGLSLPRSTRQKSFLEVTGTPRSRNEILDTSCSVLEETIAVGISHLSSVVVDRLTTLSVSAQAANISRASLALRSIANEVDSILNREARADEARLLLAMSRLYALMKAIRFRGDQAEEALLGLPRAQYVEVPELQLTGVGAYTWKSGSGFRGLTVLFWSQPAREFLTWSEARPTVQMFDEHQRFTGTGPWEGTLSPQQVSTSVFKLRNARRSLNGRLSSSSKTSALVLNRTKPSSLDFGEKLFKSWSTLTDYLRQKQPIGLRESNPLDLIVVLQPTRYGSKKFDSVSQTFYWQLADENGLPLLLSLQFNKWTSAAIEVLEDLNPSPASNWQFVVRLGHHDGRLVVEPISILCDERLEHPVFNLGFDVQSDSEVAQADTSAIVSGEDETEDELASDESGFGGDVRTGRLLAEINQHLQEVAETGTLGAIASHVKWFRVSGSESHNSGLTVLAQALGNLERESTPGNVLQARYLTHLYHQATTHLS